MGNDGLGHLDLSGTPGNGPIILKDLNNNVLFGRSFNDVVVNLAPQYYNAATFVPLFANFGDVPKPNTSMRTAATNASFIFNTNVYSAEAEFLVPTAILSNDTASPFSGRVVFTPAISFTSAFQITGDASIIYISAAYFAVTRVSDSIAGIVPYSGILPSMIAPHREEVKTQLADELSDDDEKVMAELRAIERLRVSKSRPLIIERSTAANAAAPSRR